MGGGKLGVYPMLAARIVIDFMGKIAQRLLKVSSPVEAIKVLKLGLSDPSLWKQSYNFCCCC